LAQVGALARAHARTLDTEIIHGHAHAYTCAHTRTCSRSKRPRWGPRPPAPWGLDLEAGCICGLGLCAHPAPLQRCQGADCGEGMDQGVFVGQSGGMREADGCKEEGGCKPTAEALNSGLLPPYF